MTTRTSDAAVQAYAQPPEVRLNPRFISQSLQFTKFTLKAQYFQAKPRRCSYKVALSYRLIESKLPRLLMLEPICLTAPDVIMSAGIALNYSHFPTVAPPSMGRAAPFINPASLEARNSVAAAASSKRPMRLRGYALCWRRMPSS